MLLVRYLDVCLVLATAPFVVAGDMPRTGYAIAAGAWLLTRAGGAVLLARAAASRDARVRAGLQMAAMMSRLWVVVLAVILARFAGGKGDGVMAAALSLAAFTVYFAVSFVTRPGTARAGAAGRPRTS